MHERLVPSKVLRRSARGPRVGLWVVIVAVCLGAATSACAETERAVTEPVRLPAPEHEGPPLETVIRQRRSVRSFEGALTLGEVSQLLFAAQGVTDSIGRRSLHAAPSAGATYPFTVYAVANHVEGLDAGVYRYRPNAHALEPVHAGSVGSALRAAALGQQWVETAGLVVALVADYARTTGRYGERGRRYVHMEAGHISQNLYLQAVALGLGSVAVGAFDDDRAARVLGIESPRVLLYLHPVGRPAP